MLIRIAKPDDAATLARVHLVCSADQPGGFMHRLGQSFLARYYGILLSEPGSVVLCAEDASGRLVGLCSGTLQAEEHMAALRRHRLRLLLASLPAVIRSPRLLGELQARQSAGSADSSAGPAYVVTTGPREEFWAWLPDERRAGGAIELHKKWLSLMSLLGATRVRLEVDRVNSKVELVHRLMGAKVVNEFATPDGRQRMVFEYRLDEGGPVG